MPVKKKGRPPGETYPQHLHMRVDDDFFRDLDEWRRQQPGLPNRTDAVRQLIKLGMQATAAPAAGKPPARR
jgi:hypothetical protein